jgi:hypothetical protein
MTSFDCFTRLLWKKRPYRFHWTTARTTLGLVAVAPSLAPHDTYLSIIPLYSGYRNQDTQELKFTVNYLEVYERQGLDKTVFRVVLPIASIRMASLFDHSVYPAFCVESDEPQGGELTSGGASMQN